ncbi:hypothetical protein ABXS75_03195 [Roseburia hominis]
MNKQKNETFWDVAIQLARMYGIAETLEPLPVLAWDKTCSVICEWVEEYLQLQEVDIVDFFDKKVEIIKKATIITEQ